MKFVYFAAVGLILAGCSSLPKSFHSDYKAALTSGICNVHHVKMDKEEVPIIYGLIIDEAGIGPSYKTRMTKFPFAEKLSFGGCVIMDDSPKKQMISVCPRCLDAQKEWIENHPRDLWAKKMLSSG